MNYLLIDFVGVQMNEEPTIVNCSGLRNNAILTPLPEGAVRTLFSCHGELDGRRIAIRSYSSVNLEV